MKYEITSKKEFQIEAAKALLADGQPHSYAEAYMNQHGLSATDHGYVAWNGGEIFYEYSQPEQSNSPSLSM